MLNFLALFMGEGLDFFYPWSRGWIFVPLVGRAGFVPTLVRGVGFKPFVRGGGLDLLQTLIRGAEFFSTLGQMGLSINP